MLKLGGGPGCCDGIFFFFGMARSIGGAACCEGGGCGFRLGILHESKLEGGSLMFGFPC